MRDFSHPSGLKEKLFMLAGVICGGSMTMGIISILPIAHVALISTIGLASLVVTCAYLSNHVLWWAGMGAISGIIMGLAEVVGNLAEQKEVLEFNLRLTFVVFQSMAGLIAGVLLGRRIHKAHLPTLKDFLSSLTALTVGLFAVIVTIRFIMDGLEPARSVSSRLSVATTILITLLAIPGVIGYLFAERPRKVINLTPSNTSEPPSDQS